MPKMLREPPSVDEGEGDGVLVLWIPPTEKLIGLHQSVFERS